MLRLFGGAERIVGAKGTRGDRGFAAPSASTKFPVLVPGSKAPEFWAKDSEGKKIFLNYADVQVPTVIYVFTPDCHWCARNFENIHSLATSTSGRFRFVGVSLNDKDLTKYLVDSKMPFQIYHTPSGDVSAAYRLNSTPSTIVVSTSGNIIQYWRGAYSGDMQAEIELARKDVGLSAQLRGMGRSC